MTVSMTGFGQGEAVSADLTISIEIKTVNHRFLDLVWKLPSSYSKFETELAKLVRDKFRRGRVEVAVTRKKATTTDYEIVFDEALFKQYLPILKGALKTAGVRDQDSLAVVNLLQRREIIDLVSRSADVENEAALVRDAIARALDGVQSMREVEGAALGRELLERIERLEGIAGGISPLVDSSTSAYRERLQVRIAKLEVQADPARMAQEIALFAERSDVSEELTRLRSHFAQFRSLLAEEGSGRKLDFLIQEMGREINTTGSKSQSAEISALVVEAKAELEKIREQVQNIE